MKRYLMVSASMGVYLGSCMGLGFWSKLDPVGQPSACTFESPDAALEFVATWDSLADMPGDLSFPEVEVDEQGYAPMGACVAAGAEAWT